MINTEADNKTRNATTSTPHHQDCHPLPLLNGRKSNAFYQSKSDRGVKDNSTRNEFQTNQIQITSNKLHVVSTCYTDYNSRKSMTLKHIKVIPKSAYIFTPFITLR